MRRSLTPAVFVLLLLALLGFGRLMTIQNVFFDDNAWMLSLYSTEGLEGYLDTGFQDLKRPLIGATSYFFFSLPPVFGDRFLLINLITLLTHLGTVLAVYFFVREFTESRAGPNLAFYAAAAYTLFTLDMTYGFRIHTNYRLGIMLSVISFWMTVRGVRAGRGRGFGWLGAAALLTGFTFFFLIEGVLAYEPARLMMVFLLIREKEGVSRAQALRRSALCFLPFVPFALANTVYKLTQRPEGLYDWTYPLGVDNFLEGGHYLGTVRHFFMAPWTVYIENADIIDEVSLLLAAGGLLLGAAVFLLGIVSADRREEAEAESRREAPVRGTLHLLLLAATLSVCSAMLYIYAGRAPQVAVLSESRHAIIHEFGHSLLTGSLLFLLHLLLAGRRAIGRVAMGTAVSVLFFAGVFFNNAQVDYHHGITRTQQRFWRAFTARYPSLQPGQDLFVDIRLPATGLRINLDTYYDLAYVLNMLYTPYTEPEKFIAHELYMPHPNVDMDWLRGQKDVFEFTKHWGTWTLEGRTTMFVYYDGERLLINNEILGLDPGILYSPWLGKAPPAPLPADAYPHPQRKLMPGFVD